MSCRIVVLYLLRILVLLLSLGTLGCHVAQLVLLSQESGTGSWWPDYIPYILYYVGPIVSILSVIILLILGCVQSKSLLSDRVMSIINLLLFIAIVVYNSMESGTIPWTGNVAKPFSSNTKGWASYCSNYSDTLLSIRCWLVNGTWLGMIVTGFFWLIIALYVIVTRNSDIYNEDYDTYDYKEDVPMAQRRASSSVVRQNVSAIPVPPKHQSQQQPYMSPISPIHHQSFNTSPTLNNDAYYYHQQQPQMYDTSNDYNNDYYLNPVQEEHMNNTHHDIAYQQQHDLALSNGGYERSRKISKTYLEEELSNPNNHPNNTSNISPSESVQPPHSYDGHHNN